MDAGQNQSPRTLTENSIENNELNASTSSEIAESSDEEYTWKPYEEEVAQYEVDGWKIGFDVAFSGGTTMTIASTSLEKDGEDSDSSSWTESFSDDDEDMDNPNKETKTEQDKVTKPAYKQVGENKNILTKDLQEHVNEKSEALE